MKNQFYSKTLPVLLGIFLISVLIRIPNLNRPLSKHHEFCTAVALRIMQIWAEDGIDRYHYNPVMNYPGKANKFINNHATTSRKVVDREGNYYYISHPPFGYYLPYFAFSILGVYPNVLGIQIFSILLHFLSAFFVYLIVSLLAENRARGSLSVPAMVAFVFYVFNPATMWFQSNVYMSDMLVHTIFVIGIYTTLKMIIRERFSSFKYLFTFFLIIFLMVYTSWLGIFFAITVILYGLFKAEKNSGFAIPVVLAIFAMLSAMGLMIYQYSSINGIDAYLSEAMSRFQLRGSLAMGSGGVKGLIWMKLVELKRLTINYAVNYFPVFALLATFSILMISKAKLKIVFSENGYRFLYLAGWPVIWLHIFLLNYSGHDFVTLYASVFFATLIGILYDKLLVSKAVSGLFLNLMLAVTLMSMVGMYYYFNRPGSVSWKGDTYAIHKDAGELIRTESRENEVVFVLDHNVMPQVVVYAKRNVQLVHSIEEASQFLKQRGIQDGILFKWDSSGKLIKDRDIKTE